MAAAAADDDAVADAAATAAAQAPPRRRPDAAEADATAHALCACRRQCALLARRRRGRRRFLVRRRRTHRRRLCAVSRGVRDALEAVRREIPISDVNLCIAGDGAVAATVARIDGALLSLLEGQRSSAGRLIANPDVLSCSDNALAVLADCPALSFLILSLAVRAPPPPPPCVARRLPTPRAPLRLAAS